MNLSHEIKILQARYESHRWEFYQQSFQTATMFDGQSISAQAIRIDKTVINLVEALNTIDKHIDVLEMKRKYWHKYLESLRDDELDYIIAKYSEYIRLPSDHDLDSQSLDEIEEIETAVNFQFGYEELVTGKYQLSTGDYMGNMDRILAKVC